MTHRHADHMGLTGWLAGHGSRLIMNEREFENAAGDGFWQQAKPHYVANGFPEADYDAAVSSHPGRRFASQRHVPSSLISDGDCLSYGDYTFRCVETPGHSPYHTCLYEPRKKVLISGDHILFDITPNISAPLAGIDPLTSYLASLDKVAALDVSVVLPGHRKRGPDCRARIRELKAHHHERARECLEALRSDAKTAFQVAPFLTWDLDCESFDKFPLGQKWFAVGETIAHLKYLESARQVASSERNGRVLYALRQAGN